MTGLEALKKARDRIAAFGDRAWETGNMTMAQGIGESLEILTAMIGGEMEGGGSEIKTDTTREAINEIQKIKWLIDEGPAHEKLTEAQARLTELKDLISTINPEAIRLEFWNELHAEAEAQYDHRHDMLRPVKTYAQSMIVHTMDDGWSAWLLAKRIIENRRSAILGAEPAQNDGEPEVGDVVAWVNSGGDIRVGQFGIEITQGDAVVIRRRAEVKRRIEEAKE